MLVGPSTSVCTSVLSPGPSTATISIARTYPSAAFPHCPLPPIVHCPHLSILYTFSIVYPLRCFVSLDYMAFAATPSLQLLLSCLLVFSHLRYPTVENIEHNTPYPLFHTHANISLSPTSMSSQKKKIVQRLLFPSLPLSLNKRCLQQTTFSSFRLLYYNCSFSLYSSLTFIFNIF